jgi:hypothetical protein
MVPIRLVHWLQTRHYRHVETAAQVQRQQVPVLVLGQFVLHWQQRWLVDPLQ